MRMDRIPSWTSRSLQALAYWIGWSHERYHLWPRSEAAIVGEAQALIAARLPESLVARAEVSTKELVSAKAGPLRKGRVDLVVFVRGHKRTSKSNEHSRFARALVEIKRGQAPWSAIEKDLVRLAAICRNLPKSCRAFLVVGCEAGRVSKKLIKKGRAVRSMGSFTGGRFKTRRVWAASPSLKRTSSAHYVALVEVWPE